MTGFIRKTLAQLVGEARLVLINQPTLTDVPITGVWMDSRSIEPGGIFVAVKGGNADGHRFIPDAIQRGAAAVVGSDDLQDLPVPYLQVEDARNSLALLSAAFFGYPARSMTVIGVTGTDGKTTTSNMIYHILLKAGMWAGMVSTVNAVIGGEVIDTGFHVTTPEAPDIQRYLARMVAAGLTHAILETTSHGLAQQRVTGCEYDIAVVTNITHEHLDYHGSYEGYRDAKGLLFRSLGDTVNKQRGNPRVAILNRDDESYDYLHSITPVRSVAYSLTPHKAEYWAEDIRHDPSGLHFTAVGPGFRTEVSSRLMGKYNASNALAAMAAAIEGLGIAPQKAAEGIAALDAIPGRFERVDMGQDFISIVDFAHTPNALRNVLQTVREITGKRVIAVFGSAGLRDREKRRMMAEISVELADLTFLTAEDPRTESLDGILMEMATAAQKQGGEEGRNFWRVRDRGEAIYQAVCMAQPGDVVIACGKGHEQSMCFGIEEFPWDDRVAMRSAIARRISATGPAMPYLPTQDD